jgi:hypothetical protein
MPVVSLQQDFSSLFKMQHHLFAVFSVASLPMCPSSNNTLILLLSNKDLISQSIAFNVMCIPTISNLNELLNLYT